MIQNRIRKQYDELWPHIRYNGYWYRRPKRPIVDHELALGGAAYAETDSDGKFTYKNVLGQETKKNQDISTYLSPTNYTPKRVLVQCMPYVWKENSESTWRRTKIEGDIPTVLKFSEWALAPSNPNDKTGKRSVLGVMQTCLRTLVIGLPLQFFLGVPGTPAAWNDNALTGDNYLDHPGYHWKWPKHAVNPLDMQPGSTQESLKKMSLSSKTRLIRPRQLIVNRNNDWNVESSERDDNKDLAYIFISYTNLDFNTKEAGPDRLKIRAMSAQMALRAGCKAFWLDYECRAPIEEKALLTSDVNRLCDVIRGAKQVVVMLPRHERGSKRNWGSRMWTMPEALLAQGNEISFCSYADGGNIVETVTKIAMAGEIWGETSENGEDEQPARLLAEHYTGVLTLSRLELFSTALAALGERELPEKERHVEADLAYALMGLLRYRIEPDDTDSLFQAIARLSLLNDSDRLMERMVCMFPKPNDVPRNIFHVLAQPDQFQTHLWDMQPLCQVVGVGQDDYTVLLDGCRAIAIRWKKFPRLRYKRHEGFKKFLAELFVRSVAWWFVTGVSLAWAYAPFLLANNTQDNQDDSGNNNYSGFVVEYVIYLIVGFFAVGFILSLMGPKSVRRLYGGRVTQSSPHLIGFEGVMPIRELEALIFGNYAQRLSYEPSSTPFCRQNRDPTERRGVEPSWVSSGQPGSPDPPLPRDRRLFTLVDTGTLSVSIFSAVQPPTVALICGRECGMLRVALCSWSFVNDCLYKEAVMRIPSNVWEQATAKSWLKVALGR